jgi:hypothetical protein
VYGDLLRRANGDKQLVSLWMAEMGYDPQRIKQQQQQEEQEPSTPGKIKAVGGASGHLSPALPGSFASHVHKAPSGAKPPLPFSTPPSISPSSRADSLLPRSMSVQRELDRAAAEASAPAHFVCSISMRVMRDPVLVPTGHTYDRRPIERWLGEGNFSCPATGLRMAAPVTLTPNIAVKQAIEHWAASGAPWLLVRLLCSLCVCTSYCVRFFHVYFKRAG